MRDELRSALRTMRPSNDSILSALYVSPDGGNFDVENVLLYNVGLYAHLCQNGLSFERLQKQPPQCPVELDAEARHYHRYTLDSTCSSETERDTKSPIAWWNSLSLPRLNSDTKPHVYWAHMRKHSVETTVDSVDGEFELELTLSAPQGTNTYAATLVKSLVDGVVSAFHVHDGSQLAEVSARLSRLTDESQPDIEDQLMKSNVSLLGTTNLVYPYLQEVKWNPGDHLCRKAELSLQYTDGPTWSMSGRMYQA